MNVASRSCKASAFPLGGGRDTVDELKQEFFGTCYSLNGINAQYNFQNLDPWHYGIKQIEHESDILTCFMSGTEVNLANKVRAVPDTIAINEVCYSPDFIELYNYGSDKAMTGWTIQIYHNNLLDGIYTFPSGWIFHSQYVVVLNENTGTNTDTVLYTGWNIPWGSNVAVGLFDNTGAHVDWVQVSIFTGSPPGDIQWNTDISLTFSGAHIYRTSDDDTNRASDWTSSSSGSQGTLNPGQTGIPPDPDPDPFGLAWIWILIIVANIAIVAAVVLKRRQSRIGGIEQRPITPAPTTQPRRTQPEVQSKSRPRTRLKVNLSQIKKKYSVLRSTPSKKLASMDNIFKTPPFHCHHCDITYELEKFDKSALILCSECGGIMLRLVECYHCQNRIPILQDIYNNENTQTIHCFYCDSNFFLRREEAVELTPEITRSATEPSEEPEDKSEDAEATKSTRDMPQSEWDFKTLVFELNTYNEPDNLIPVIWRLGEMGDTKAVPHLIKTLALSDEKECRNAAIIALGKVGGPLAMDALYHASKTDPDFLVRYNAAITLNHVNYPKQDSAVQSENANVNELADEISSRKAPDTPKHYLKIEPDRFMCSNCKAKYSIKKINILKQYTCPICNGSLNRLLNCVKCTEQIPFNQDDFFRFLPLELECPTCMNKPKDSVYSNEKFPIGNITEDELNLLFSNILSENKTIQLEGVNLIKEIINKHAIPSLIGILMYEKVADIRTLAAIALGMIGIPEILPILRHIADLETDELVQKYLTLSIKWMQQNGN